MVLSSNLLADLMDRYPSDVYLGAGVLGKVGGEMILTRPVDREESCIRRELLLR